MSERRLTPEDLDRIERTLRALEEPEPAWKGTMEILVTEIRRTWDDLRRAMAYLPPPALPSSPPGRVFAGWDEAGGKDRGVTQVQRPEGVDLPGTGVEYHEVIRWEGEGGKPVEEDGR